MALRQLAGPFPIVDGSGNPVGGSALSAEDWVWVPDIGIVVDIDTKRCVLAMDGVYQDIGSKNGNIGLGWWTLARRMVLTSPTGIIEYVYDQRVMTLAQAQPDAIDGIWPNNYIRWKNDIRIWYQAPFVRRSPGGADAVNINSSTGINDGSVWLGRTEDEIFIRETFGHRGVFYDLVKSQISSPVMKVGSSPVNGGVIYSPDYKVLISFQQDPNWNLRIWSLEPVPGSLSNPVVIAGDVQQGREATFQVQLLGTDSEPIAGEFIDWSVSGVGELETTQSTTDANGLATAKVRYLIDDTGSSVVGASYRC